MTNEPTNYLNSIDFKNISFHDNHLYGFFFRKKEFGEDLVIDIDYILEWICNDNSCTFKILPATLTFFDLVDLKIDLSWGKSLFQHPKCGVTHISSGTLILNGIKMEKYKNSLYNNKDYRYHKYIFDFIIPDKGVLNFGASKVSLIGRQPPVESKEQHFNWMEWSKRSNI